MLKISIIIFAIEIVALCFFIYAKYISKKIKYTRTIFTSTVFLINFAVYMLAYCYKMQLTGEGQYLLGVISSIASSMGSFLFRPSITDIMPITSDIPFFIAPFAFGFALGLFTTISLIVDAFRYRIRNSIRFLRILGNKEIDYVIGDGAAEIHYARNYKNTVLLLPSDTSREKINSYIRQGFCVYPRLSKNFDTIIKMRKKNNRKYVFIMFDDDDTDNYIRAIDAFRRGSDEEVKDTYLYLEVKYEKIEYLKNVLLCDERTKIHVMLFNRYENMTNDMCSKVPLTTFLPKDFVNEDTSIKSEKKINVFLVGFGWANQEMYKKLLINNQFVEQTKEGYKAHLVNYYIFDVDENKKSIYALEGIESLFARLEKQKDEYFDLPEKLSNTKFIAKNVESAGILDDIEDICVDKDSMNYFFISYSDNYHNLNLTAMVYERLKNTNFHIFTRTTERSLCDKNLKNITYFGNTIHYLVHDKIVNYELYNIGVKVNDAYVGHATTLHDLFKKDFIKIYANYYQAMNIRKKYHLLGFDFVKENELLDSDVKIEEFEFYDRIGIGSIKKYEDYSNHMTLAAAVATEHLHWNCEYFVFGYKPLKKANHEIVDGNIIEQDVANKLHGALTSIKGLDLRARHILDLYHQLGENDKVLFSIDGINSVEVLKYDYQFLAKSYTYLLSEGYIVIKKR